MTTDEQAGYDAFVEAWLKHGDGLKMIEAVKSNKCPAVGSDERKAFMRGWLKARDEV